MRLMKGSDMKKLVSVVVILLIAVVAFAAAPQRAAAPEFSLRDLQGRTHTLSKMKGKVVVIDFGRVICIPCRKVMDDLNLLHKAYAGKGVNIYSVNLGVDSETVKRHIADKKLTFPFLQDPDMKVTQSYGVQSIPYLVVIDKNGRISNTHIGYPGGFKDMIESEIKTLLAEKAK